MIRRAESADAGRIADIQINGWRNAYRGMVEDTVLFKKLSIPAKALALEAVLQEGAEEWYVYEEDEIVKGILLIGKSRDEDLPDAFELWCIYVDHFMLRSGIGKSLLDFCESTARSRGFRSVILWVLEKNVIGRNFYEKYGYRVEGKKQDIEKLKVTEVRYIKEFNLEL